MPMKKPIHFKFRARSSTDVQKAMALLPDGAEVRWLSEHRNRQFPGCTVRLGRTRMGLRAVRHWLAKVPDAPMMYQTLALEADYTGEPIFKSIAQVAEAARQSEAWKPDPAFRHYARHEDAITRLVESRIGHDRAFRENRRDQRSTPEQAGAIRRYRHGWFSLIIEALSAKADEYASDDDRNQLTAMRQQLVDLTGHIDACLGNHRLDDEAGDVALARLREIVADFQPPG